MVQYRGDLILMPEKGFLFSVPSLYLKVGPELILPIPFMELEPEAGIFLRHFCLGV